MATDKNKFDDHLKEKLYRDIIFRIIVWGAIAAATTFFASKSSAFNLIEYFNDYAKKVAPLINAIGTTALILAMPALVLKDLEHVSPSRWGYNSKASSWGGFIRRLAGDLTLWVIGAFTSFFFALVGSTVQAVLTGSMTIKNGISLITLYFMIAIFMVILAITNIMVRRSQPPLAATKPFSLFMTSSWRVAAIYGFALIVIYLLR